MLLKERNGMEEDSQVGQESLYESESLDRYWENFPGRCLAFSFNSAGRVSAAKVTHKVDPIETVANNYQRYAGYRFLRGRLGASSIATITGDGRAFIWEN